MGSASDGSRSHAGTRTLAAIGAGALSIYGLRVLINLFGTSLPYSMKGVPGNSIESDEFLQFLSLVTDAQVRRSRIRPLTDGPAFYPEELAAIRRARCAINLEFYEFLPGEIAGEILQALTERARAGVEVRIVIDALGSFSTPRSIFRDLEAAGGQMRWYHPLRWNTWQRANNRTHRKLLIVDGNTAFVGGAGVADQWLHATSKGPRWRDTVFCVEGEAVAGLIGTFSENWLEASGEILSSSQQFGFHSLTEGAPALVVSSTPSGGGTHARILFQALINSARKSICITTPYFLPDHSARHALIAAARRREVSVRILVAGPRIDHPMIRTMSRHSSRHLLEAGAKIFEYQPSMLHAKIMVIDDAWCIMGSTNFDHRSFALNDEVNVATLDRELAAALNRDFEHDLSRSRELTLAMLKSRGLFDSLNVTVGALLENES
jgi:cardiolipin synthase